MQGWTMILPAFLWLWLARKRVARSRIGVPMTVIIVRPGLAIMLQDEQEGE